MIDWDVALLRLALALACGAAIGVEREWRQKHAGLKTMSLVAVGAAGFSMMSDTFGAANHNPAQIAAAVVGGIGFIGAGVIMHRGSTVQGVTTAATLWAAASAGVAAGLGHYPLALLLTALIVLVQITMRGAERKLHQMNGRNGKPGRFELRVECDGETLHDVNDAVARYAAEARIQQLRRAVQRGPEHVLARSVFRTPAPVDLGSLEERLAGLDGVKRVELRHLGIEEE